MTSTTESVPQPRPLGAVHWLGLTTMIAKEIDRFLKAYPQTVMAPVISTLLFYTVFAIMMGGPKRSVGDVPFLTFLVPGLIMMTMAQNAFMNTSGSLVLSKLQGNIVDILMTPLSSFELTISYVISGIARGLMTGVLLVFCFMPLVDVSVKNAMYILYHAVAGSMMFASLGVLAGIWADKFDHVITVHSFIVLPATFLSGAFSSLQDLPEKWHMLCYLNPFFYIVDGFRYGFIGVADSDLLMGALFALVVNLGLLGFAYHLFDSGYKLKA